MKAPKYNYYVVNQNEVNVSGCYPHMEREGARSFKRFLENDPYKSPEAKYKIVRFKVATTGEVIR